MGFSRVSAASEGARLGGKGAALQWLERNGALVPETFVVEPGEASVHAELSAALPPGRYAVRSSANVEDGPQSSFAGQFLTKLDVDAVDVPAAVEAVRASASSEAVETYSAGRRQQQIEMSVLIQAMVPAAVSGVVFTRNPITGLNEVVLEAVEGRGDRLVGEGVTPHRWIRRWGEWTEQPDQGLLPDEVAVAIVDEALDLADRYGAPADLEWVWDGTKVWWVQIRPITGISGIGIYSNRISKEVMPGLIKPLVWSVNVPVVNRAWIRLFTEAIGDNDLEPSDLARSFAYRSYFNMGAIGDIFELMGMPHDSLESLLGLPEGPDKPKFKPSAATMRKLPRLLAFAAGKTRYGRNRDQLLGSLEDAYRRHDRSVDQLSDQELLDAIDDLMEVGTDAAYVNIVVPLLANLYRGILDKRMAKRGVDLTTVDIKDQEAAADLDPNPHLDALGRLIVQTGVDSPAVVAALETFLDKFGHFSDSGNDFSVAPWREQPELVLQMAEHRGVVRHSDARRSWSEVAAAAGPVARLLRKRAARYAERRDQVSSLYTHGYGLFRKYFLEIGERLAAKGVLAEADDVMYLTLDEVRNALLDNLAGSEARAIVERHKAELERVKDLVMPETIYGDDFIPASPVDPDNQLHGVATSRGHHRGPVRVVTGIADFAKVQPGDVLAIPFSDVGWTPLFAKAGAVVAESGGMLSHSSIVAREYGIPCVVSVPGATRLVDGTMVTVDGYRGDVTPDT